MYPIQESSLCGCLRAIQAASFSFHHQLSHLLGHRKRKEKGRSSRSRTPRPGPRRDGTKLAFETRLAVSIKLTPSVTGAADEAP